MVQAMECINTRCIAGNFVIYDGGPLLELHYMLSGASTKKVLQFRNRVQRVRQQYNTEEVKDRLLSMRPLHYVKKIILFSSH